MSQTQPQITGVTDTDLNYGEIFTVSYQSSATIESVVLMRPSAVTHPFNTEQRLIRCHFTDNSGTLTVTAPWSKNAAPPGWYMLFIVADENGPGIPSSNCQWVHLEHPCGNNAFLMFEPGETDVSGNSVEVQNQVFGEHPITVEIREPDTRNVVITLNLPMRTPDTRRLITREINLPDGPYEVYVHPYLSWLGKRQTIQ